MADVPSATADTPDLDMAPAYEEIVRREGRDEANFCAVRAGRPFSYDNLRLFDHEKADVIAYLMTLQRDSESRP